MRSLIFIGASALLGGCIGVQPAVNPTVEVWNVQPAPDRDVADVIIEQVVDQAFSLASSALDDSSAEPTKSDSGCFFWCFHGQRTRPVQPVPQPIAGPAVYSYSSYGEPPRPATRVSSTAQAPAFKPTSRPAHASAPKEHVHRQTTHAPATKPSAPKASKPATTSKSNPKKDKR